MKSVFFAALLILAAGIFSTGVAHAYPAGSPSPAAPLTPSSSVTINGSFETLFAPFASFFASLSNSSNGSDQQSMVGNPMDMPVSSVSGVNFTNIQNTNPQQILQEVEQWFEHLNPTEVLRAFLNLLLWVLWLTQQLVQWLLGLVH